MKGLGWAENLLNAVLVLGGLWLVAGLNYPYGWALMGLGVVYFAYRHRHLWHLWKAQGAFKSGGLDAALPRYEKAYKTGNMTLRMTVTYAYLCLKAGQIERAKKILDFERKRRGSLPATHEEVSFIKSYQALVDWKSGDLDGAIGVLRDLLDHNYRTASLYGSLGYFLLEKKVYAEALTLNREAADYAPEDPVILDNLAATYRLLNQLQDAGPVFERLMALEPAFPEAWYNYGQYLKALGRQDEARAAWEKALSLPFTPLTTLRRGEVEAALK